MTHTELIFIYNADSSVFGVVTDYVHKMVSPDTYKCNLCKITYSSLGMRKEWKEFIQQLPMKSTFLHKDEFAKEFPKVTDAEFPSLYIVKNTEPELLISSKEINQVSSIKELKKLVQAKVPS